MAIASLTHQQHIHSKSPHSLYLCNQMKEALFYEKSTEEDLSVRCHLCNHYCFIRNNRTGLCNVRKNIDGKLVSLVYGKIITENIDPIEKKPVFHFLPGTLSYSIATVGCNFRCRHCQNYQISQYKPLPSDEIPGPHRLPEQIVNSAIQRNCRTISYTYIEPTVFFEFAYETAIIAKEKGLFNIFVSNGYTSKKATEAIAPYLDANNIDLKSLSDKFYKDICGAKLAPVLDTIQIMKELGVSFGSRSPH